MSISISGGHVVSYQDILDCGRRMTADDNKFPQYEATFEGAPEGVRTLSPGVELLYKGLGVLEHTPIEDEVVDEILDRHLDLSHWSRHRRISEKLGEISILDRDIEGLPELPKLPESVPERRLFKTKNNLLVVTRQIDASYLHEIVDIERSIEQSEYNTDVVRHLQALQTTFHDYNSPKQSVKEKPGDPFTNIEEAVLGLMIHYIRNEDIANLLGTSASSISRILNPIADRYGVESKTDLILIGLSNGVTTIDNLPEGFTDLLSEQQTDFMQKYFSNDPAVRNAQRSLPKGTIGSSFKRAADSIGVNGSETLVKHLVRDGVIDYPDFTQQPPV